jgi:hypothetical protein
LDLVREGVSFTFHVISKYPHLMAANLNVIITIET